MIDHELYEQNGASVAPYDIALIEVNPPFVFNNYVQPIDLPKAGSRATELLTLSGWGYVSTDRSDIVPDVLQKANLKLLSQLDCFLQWKYPISAYHHTNLCAGFRSGLPSACKGDSGGPLAVRKGSKATLYGVVSWGMYPCGVPQRPAVFTDVAQFINWIQEKTK